MMKKLRAGNDVHAPVGKGKTEGITPNDRVVTGAVLPKECGGDVESDRSQLYTVREGERPCRRRDIGSASPNVEHRRTFRNLGHRRLDLGKDGTRSAENAVRSLHVSHRAHHYFRAYGGIVEDLDPSFPARSKSGGEPHLLRDFKAVAIVLLLQLTKMSDSSLKNGLDHSIVSSENPLYVCNRTVRRLFVRRLAGYQDWHLASLLFSVP